MANNNIRSKNVFEDLQHEYRKLAQKHWKAKYLWQYYMIKTKLLSLLKKEKSQSTFENVEKVRTDHRWNFSKNSKHLIIFSQVAWNSLMQRPQQLAQCLRDLGVTIWYVDPVFSKLEYAREKTMDPLIYPIEDRIYRVVLHSHFPYEVHRDSCTANDADFFHKQILRLLDRSNIPQKHVRVLCNHVFWLPVVQQLKNEMTFDCLDDISGFVVKPKNAERDEQNLAKHAKHIVVTSKALEEKFHHYKRKIIHIPNGCNTDHFEKYERKHHWMSTISRKKIVYFGHMDVWFDRNLLQSLARKRKDWMFVFIGPIADPRIYELALEDNVVFTGKVEYKELPICIQEADVCVIPFTLLPVILATDPVKFYEILAAGKPVVSSPIPPIIQFSREKGVLYLAKTLEQWETQIENAMRENSPQLIKKRKQVAAQHTWKKRATLLKKVLYET